MNKEYILLIAIVIGLVVAGLSQLIPTKNPAKGYVTNVVSAVSVAGVIFFLDSYVSSDDIIQGAAPF